MEQTLQNAERIKIDFIHHQSAHCENGVVSNLMKFNGVEVSEPMVFGIGSGLLFTYIPFLKVNHAPAFSYRSLPGSIFNKFAKRVGITIKRQKFKTPQKAQASLDEQLAKKNPVGLQVGVFHLSYFPEDYRFHFNAHNMVVFGKTEKTYLISDPVMEYTTELTPKELEKVRFAKGAFAPKGHMYYPIKYPKEITYKSAIKKGISETCKQMLAPVPIVGVKGIRLVAKKIRKWPKTKGIRKANHYLGQIVRMQEEIGTGGGGFRFIYAAFLEEAGKLLENQRLQELSKEMTSIGDKWRDFALEASRIYKRRSAKTDAYNVVADQLLAIADLEEAFFKRLKKVNKTL